MGFFDQQRSTPGQMSEADMRQAFMRDANGLKNDPAAYIDRAGVDIPQQLRNNPRAMAMHLINSGQVPQQRLQMLAPMLRRAGIQI